MLMRSSGAPLLLVAHAGDAAQEPAPVAEVLLRFFVALLRQPLGLVECDLVQRQLHRVPVGGVGVGHALGDLADDVLALAVEPEDRRVVRLR